MKTNTVRYLLLSALATAILAPQGAQAQMVDYGSLQTLFNEPITTSATGTPQRESDVPANMTIITADEIRQSGSRNIPEILSRVPGLDILQTGIDSFDVGVRGYQQPLQPRMLVLIDGRQVFLDDYSRTNWSNLPVNVDDIRQIEVVKGAASALFGSNAASGVINIVTYSPVYDHSNVANATIGTQHSFTGDGTVTRNGDWGGTKFSVGGLAEDEFNTGRYPLDGNPTPGNPGGTNPPRHSYIANNSVFQLTPDLQASAEGTYSHSVNNFGDPTDFGTMGVEDNKSFSGRGGLTWNSPYGVITNDNYINRNFVDFEENFDGGVPYGTTMDLVVSKLQDQFKYGADNTFRLGLEYRYRDYHLSDYEVIDQSPLLVQKFISPSGAWLWQVNDRLSWTNAVRLDHESMSQNGTLVQGAVSSYADYSHDDNAVSANSDLVYKATDLDSIRFGFGQGVMMPSFVQNGYNEVYFYPILGPQDVEGNPKLKPTIVDDYSLDYSRKVTSLSSIIKTSIFYEQNRDLSAPFVLRQTVSVGPNGTPAQYAAAQNVGGSHGWGAELELKGNESGFRWDASYSLARIIDEGEDVRTLVDYQGSSPEHEFRLLLGYTTGAWEFDENTRYATGTNMLRSPDGGSLEYPTSTGPYLAVSGRIGYKITDNVTTALSGTTLTQSTTTESAWPAVERQVFLSLTGKF